jgi:hypothetical protein
MKEIKEVIIERKEEDSIIQDKVKLTYSSLFGWKVVYPYRNEDGTINWKNLISGGSWYKLGIVIFIVLIILGCISEYSNSVKIANDCLSKGMYILPLK